MTPGVRISKSLIGSFSGVPIWPKNKKKQRCGAGAKSLVAPRVTGIGLYSHRST